MPEACFVGDALMEDVEEKSHNLNNVSLFYIIFYYYSPLASRRMTFCNMVYVMPNPQSSNSSVGINLSSSTLSLRFMK